MYNLVIIDLIKELDYFKVVFEVLLLVFLVWFFVVVIIEVVVELEVVRDWIWRLRYM